MKVDITHRDAIYVDDYRITHRGTKWGTHQILESFTVKDKNDVVSECLKRGYKGAVENIDNVAYLQ